MTDPRRDQLVEELTAAQRELGDLFFETRLRPLLETELTVQQLRALAIVQVDGETTSQRLAEVLGISAATVSGIVDRLVAAGMAERHADPHDGRVRRLRTTGKGAAAIRRLVAYEDDTDPEVFALLDVDDLAALTRGVTALLDVARRRAAGG
ncbi:MarR family winged helix-turn-helix transcriptional regulator [Antribacter gilvus]|uniref:MarR family winged helix-turn-helix transcriptional regulator n=1 Tax=Antribacter gilvus TaxID=2304675 RepID=UPI000F7AABCF|nr:MarR family transcriptional regulator [Antribacter gilvus]